MPTTAPLSREYVAPTLVLRGRRFDWGARTYLMGIINVTPDSFSGDGIHGDPAAAAALAARFEAEGADMLDIGAESSRPGAAELDPADELRRLLPALEAVRAATDLPLSVDTYHPAVAEVALAHGADAINDIMGLRRDPSMAALAARTGCVLIAMHNQRERPFRDVADDIRAGFDATLVQAVRAGIDPSRVILDPGFGFGWTPEQNVEMVRRLPELWSFRMPLLLGPSRKSTLGFVLGTAVDERAEGTAALTALGAAGGADIIRVHDVAAMRRVLKVTDAVVRANWQYQPGNGHG